VGTARLLKYIIIIIIIVFLVGEYRRSWIVLFYIVAIIVLEISTLNKRLQAVRITCVLM